MKAKGNKKIPSPIFDFRLLVEIHKRFCEKRKIRYSAESLKQDLSWNCHEAAIRLEEILKERGIKARAVYGFYKGPAPGANHKAPFHRHGWVVTSSGQILDPTRWVFEGKLPYLFEGKASVYRSQYDEGMRETKNEFRSPFPKKDPTGRKIKFNWSEGAKRYLLSILGGHDPKVLTVMQVMWLANHDFLDMGEHIHEIYSQMIERNFLGFIPIDNRKYWESIKQDFKEA